MYIFLLLTKLEMYFQTGFPHCERHYMHWHDPPLICISQECVAALTQYPFRSELLPWGQKTFDWVQHNADCKSFPHHTWLRLVGGRKLYEEE